MNKSRRPASSPGHRGRAVACVVGLCAGLATPAWSQTLVDQRAQPTLEAGLQPVDLRIGDQTPPGTRSTLGAAEGSHTLVARSNSAVSVLLPRSSLNSAPGAAASGTHFVIGSIPPWLARQHGLVGAGAELATPPATMLDRLIGLREVDRSADRGGRLAPFAAGSVGRRAPTHPAVALGRDLSVSGLLRRALERERMVDGAARGG